jgi:hypothetical protein
MLPAACTITSQRCTLHAVHPHMLYCHEVMWHLSDYHSFPAYRKLPTIDNQLVQFLQQRCESRLLMLPGPALPLATVRSCGSPGMPRTGQMIPLLKARHSHRRPTLLYKAQASRT